MTQSVTHGPDHKMHSIRSGYCSMNLVPAVANIRDHLVSQCSNKITSRQMVSQDSALVRVTRICPTPNNSFCRKENINYENHSETTSSLRAMTAKKLTMTKIDDKPWS